MCTPFLQSSDAIDDDDNQPDTLSQVSLSYDEDPNTESVHLMDDQERLLINSEQDFIDRLKIDSDHQIQVVSAFGNTGEGISYTLNHTFFKGKEIFKTSPYQDSCTMGAWAKYNPKLKIICIDTEGFRGISNRELQRTRLLLKIVAISDVIIYRTRSDRLQRDLYTFLGGASKSYTKHLGPLLREVEVDKSAAPGGRSVIIFHETRHGVTLNGIADVKKSPEDIIRGNFAKLEENCDGFGSLKYIRDNGVASFRELRVVVEKELEGSQVRAVRNPRCVFLALKVLNEKFQGQIFDLGPQLYLSALFPCEDKCLSCGAGCSLSMGHKDQDEPHFNKNQCLLQNQYQNLVYLCKNCYDDGSRQVIEPSYQAAWSSYVASVWSGYTIDCPKCGKIYQNREYWYGNKNPNDEAVGLELVHVWPEDQHDNPQTWLLGLQNSPQKILDGVTSLSQALASAGAQPTKMIADWVTDRIAPTYWRPNHEITECFLCKDPFLPSSIKHHCRKCGEGFCERCSSRRQPVPSRGWTEDVRVCDDCYSEGALNMNDVADGAELRTRRLGESVVNSIVAVKEMIKNSARPAYWTPDNECISCSVCEGAFGELLELYHCRNCGKGVCDKCSSSRKPVPVRGWEGPVRVCDKCQS